MQRIRVTKIVAVSTLLAFILILTTVAARADPDAPFTLTWDTVVSGGSSTGGPYTLSDTAGQPAAGASSGGSFTLVDGSAAVGGGGVAPPAAKVYLPAISR